MSTSAVNLTGSLSRTSTPARAIVNTTALAARTAPSIPPSSRAFEPPVKSVLRHRLVYNVFLYSAVLSWVLAIAWMHWCQEIGIGGSLLIPIMPSTVFWTCAHWAIGVLPILVLRKVYLTAHPSSATSPSKTLQNALSKPSTSRSLITYTTSAILLTFVHLLTAYAHEAEDPRLWLFVKSKKHPYYLNGRFVFLLFSQVTLACMFLLRNIMLDRFVFRWMGLRIKKSKWPFAAFDLIKTYITSIVFTLSSLTISAVLFALGRTVILPLLFKLPLLHYILRPLTAHFLRGSWTLFLPFRHFSLLFRSFFLGLTTVATWEWTEVLFDAFIPQPVKVANSTSNPPLTLISGISSTSDPYFRYFAYAELNDLAADDSPTARANRTALFGDQKYNPTMWSTLAREGLLLLGRDYQLFLRRGKPPSATATPAKPPAKLPEAPSTPLIQKPIFKATPQSPLRSVLDSFASDGAVSQVAETGASRIPELFRSVESIVTPIAAPAVQTVGAKQVEVKGLVEKAKEVVVSYVSPPRRVRELRDVWGEWWRKDRLAKVVEGCLPYRELDALVVEGLSRLICASLEEDCYGVVQRDIPRVLEAFLSFLSAIESYQVEINALYTPPSDEPRRLSAKEVQAKETLRIEVEKAGDALGIVADALKEGVVRIVRTFGDRLLAFKFPPRIANKLQGFVDYR